MIMQQKVKEFSCLRANSKGAIKFYYSYFFQCKKDVELLQRRRFNEDFADSQRHFLIRFTQAFSILSFRQKRQEIRPP